MLFAIRLAVKLCDARYALAPIVVARLGRQNRSMGTLMDAERRSTASRAIEVFEISTTIGL